MRIAIAMLAAAAALSTFATAASADPRYREQVHADSFGNLVVYAPGGYKRIVVDKGYLAGELAAYGRPQAHEDAPKLVSERPCRRLPVRAFGRSYMYGLPDHVVPVFESPCG